MASIPAVRLCRTACGCFRTRVRPRKLDFCTRRLPHIPSGDNRRCRKSTSTTLAVADTLQAAVSAALEPNPGIVAGAGVNSLVFLFGIQVLLRGLTPAGVLHSWVLGTAVYSAFGLGGYVLVCLYFIVGSAVTKVKLEQKQKEGIAEARSGRRGPASVWGSGLAGTACAIAALFSPTPHLWQVGFIASFGSKLSDTVSSEIGKAYGRTTYLVSNFQIVPRGTEGAVSLEGTAAGIAAAAVYAACACAIGQVTVPEVLICTAACTVANYLESVIGATVQGKVDWLTNDIVNVIQISIAALLAMAGKLALSV